MTGIKKDFRVANKLLKELGLDLQTALDAMFAISFTDTFGYPKGDDCDTIIVSAGAMRILGMSIIFSFPEINPAPTLDVYGGTEDPSGMIDNDQLHIIGIEYFGKGHWHLVGEFESDNPSLEEYYTTADNTLAVQVLPKKK